MVSYSFININININIIILPERKAQKQQRWNHQNHMAEIQESMVESVVKRGMSDQSNPQADVEAGQDPGFGATGERFVPLDGAYSVLCR